MKISATQNIKIEITYDIGGVRESFTFQTNCNEDDVTIEGAIMALEATVPVVSPDSFGEEEYCLHLKVPTDKGQQDPWDRHYGKEFVSESYAQDSLMQFCIAKTRLVHYLKSLIDVNWSLESELSPPKKAIKPRG